jgi:ATP-dependent RNA helicase DDX6/DHH1
LHREEVYVKKSEAQDDNDDSWKDTIQKPPKDLRPKTEDVTATRGLEWDDFCLRKEVLMGIVGCGFDKPSPVQEEVIPIVLASKFSFQKDVKIGH